MTRDEGRSKRTVVPERRGKVPGLTGIVATSTLVQALASMAILTVPAVAPSVAASLGVPAAAVGFQISLLYLAATVASLFGGTLIRRYGACRTSQLCMAATALGCAIAAVPTVPTLALGSLIMGAAYGLPNPAASHLLVRHTPPAHRNLVFSIKQTGVPLGGVAAGLLAPPVTAAFGWQAALILVAVAAAAAVLVEQPMRARLDDDRDPGAPLLRLPLEGLAAVVRQAPLRRLSLAAFCFSGVQLCVMGFLVVLLVEELGVDIITAGVVLAAVQAAGVAGRMLWGLVADRAGDGLLVLAGLGLVMTGTAAAVTVLPAGAPLALVAAIALLLGLTAIGWNGVFLAEVARLSPPGAISSVTGSAMMVTFLGVMVAPTAFALLHDQLGSYRSGYGLLALLGFAGMLLTIAARRGAPVARPPAPRP